MTLPKTTQPIGNGADDDSPSPGGEGWGEGSGVLSFRTRRQRKAPRCSRQRGAKFSDCNYLRAISAAFGLISRVIADFLETDALHAVSPPQQAMLPLSAETDTGASLATVEVLVVFAEQQGLSPAALESLDTLVSPACTARANATNTEEKRSFFIASILPLSGLNATGSLSVLLAAPPLYLLLRTRM
jgi:hypothetical protein